MHCKENVQTLEEIVLKKLDGNPCFDRMGELEEMRARLDAQEGMIVQLCNQLSQSGQIAIAQYCGFEEYIE